MRSRGVGTSRTVRRQKRPRSVVPKSGRDLPIARLRRDCGHMRDFTASQRSWHPYATPAPFGRRFDAAPVACSLKSFELDVAFLEYLIPPRRLLANESLEFLWCVHARKKRRGFELLLHDGIGVDSLDFAVKLLDDWPRRAGGRNQPSPARKVVEGGETGGFG